ncbi:MAG: TrkH family potassium uptake protein, partial [Clostridiales Family XIII bacterium]|nr:TrkH family potassium uptake protein [Clostridiales Family XIII bacterium]
GGLSTRSLGIAEFRDPFIEYVIAAFCLLSSINFINYRELLARRWRNFFRDPELRAFVGTIAACTAFIGASLWLSGGYASAHDSFKQAFLQVSALVSTSGYVTADFSLWPSACQWLILILIMVGGCSSSTAGGLKIIRVQIMLRLMLRNVYKRLHPRAVVAVKLGGKAVSAETASNVSAFLLTYFAIFVLGTFVLAAMDGKDMLTSLSAAAAALSNNSVGFGQIGHLGTFGVFSAPARVFLALLMIVGRLEIFTVLILFTPAYWRMGRG